MKNIPNIISLINLFLGCTAIVLIMKGLPVTGAILIGIGALLDFLDGALARLLNAGSPVGEQLDSLADLVSFGIAPATILFYYMHAALPLVNPESLQIVYPLAAYIIAVFSAMRLAIFNTDQEQRDHFKGLPTPANALLIASFPVVLAFDAPDSLIAQIITSITGHFWITLAFTVLLSWLLVSPVRMFSLKVKNFAWSENRIRYIFLTGCLLLLIIFGPSAIPLFLIFYILLSLTDHLFSFRRKRT